MGIGLWVALSLGQDALETFKQRIAAAKSVHEKAAALRALGDAQPRDPAAVPALARYLNPQGGDCHGLLPTTAAEALGNFRGSVAAARVLTAAAEACRKNPYLFARYVDALSRVGHEAGFALFEEALRGPGAAAAIKTIATFPASVAVEALLVEGRKLDRKQGDDVAKVREEIVKGLQKLSGEKYPSLAEFELWWKKRGPAFRVEAEAREKAAASGRAPALPLLVELCFREGQGMSTANSGAASHLSPSALLGNGAPAWTAQAPINAGPGALEWSKEGGAQAVELPLGDTLKNLKSFTISGWILRTDPREDPAAGQKILGWIGHSKSGEGVDLAARSDGRLQLGINQPAEQSTLATPPGQLRVLDAKAKDPGQAALDAWRFFAVTYDSTASADHVKFYVGGWNDDAKLVGKSTSSRGPVGAKTAPALTMGNASGPLRAGGQRAFRGVLDEIRIHGSAVDGGGALNAEAVLRTQNRQTPAP